MSATAVISPFSQLVDFLEASVGKKVVMAVTGVILFGFVIGHLVGNLQVFLGPEKLDAYSEFLHHARALLWVVRIVLLVSVTLHIVTSIQLTVLKQKARPVGYERHASIASSYASRTMMWSGPIIAAFVVYHLLHFTFGAVHPDFEEGHVYHNVVAGFSVIPVSIAYILAMLLLGLHLYHGVWSMFQTLGVSNPRYSALLRRFAALATAGIVIGNISIPVAVMTGIVNNLP